MASTRIPVTVPGAGSPVGCPRALWTRTRSAVQYPARSELAGQGSDGGAVTKDSAFALLVTCSRDMAEKTPPGIHLKQGPRGEAPGSSLGSSPGSPARQRQS